MIVNKNIDGGKGFDFGRTSADYAKYRDIYPDEFYEYLLQNNICIKGQTALDIGTGTGILPRNMYKYGAKFTGVDIAKNQINQAKLLSKKNNMDIRFLCSSAEDINFPDESFDVATACQCFAYFNHTVLASVLNKILKKTGRFAVLYMAWLPYEDKIAEQSEKLVLKYSPNWSGCGETRHEINIPKVYSEYFEIEKSDIFDVSVPFSRETWNGRMKSCRGVGASLSKKDAADFDKEHMELLNKIAPDEFNVRHYIAAVILSKKQVNN